MKYSANSVWENKDEYDVVVVGAGHAGCEAALATARLGFKTVIFTVSVDSIALMPCNPNIGGTSKGHLVKEIDALGGEMGKNIDKTFIQSKMLNKSKGPAVHSLRAQADKRAYSQSMREVLENTDHLTIRQMEIAELIVEDGVLTGVKAVSGAIYHCKAAVLCTGVYLNARCIYGDVSTYTGPNGLQAANHLTDSLKANGIEMYRFKTGTPARADKRSIDFSKMEEQFGDKRVVPFSFSTDPESIQKEQISCWLTYTNEKTHEIIRNNLERSPLFSGAIEGTGPRYCPSIEDKVVKFPDKERHQVFVEPEGLYTNEMYLGGMSSSLPEDVQYAMYRTVPGLENIKIVRNAYAIEYDCINPRQLKASLEFKNIDGLFSGGQFNGSSGYEEAAVQGFMAGVNAATAFAAARSIPLIYTTHQQGHAAAALFAARGADLFTQKVLLFHISGGTTDLLLCDEVRTITQLGTSTDLYAGQAVDRVGVKLGFAFPAGAEVSRLAAACPEEIRPKSSVRGMQCSLSGLENQCNALLAAGKSPEYVCKYCLLCVADTVVKMTKAAQKEYPGLPVVCAGGVMSSDVIRQWVQKRLPQVYFVPGQYSSDNAIGVSILAAREAGLWLK